MSGAQNSLLRAGRWRRWEYPLWLLAFALPRLLPRHALIINEIAIVALFALALDLILGFSGVVSLGHAAFFGMGAYAAALFAKLVMPDPLLGLLVGIAAAAFNNGLTEDDIKEVIMHAACYCGVPAGNHAFAEASETLRKIGRPPKPLPAPKKAKTKAKAKPKARA